MTVLPLRRASVPTAEPMHRHDFERACMTFEHTGHAAEILLAEHFHWRHDGLPWQGSPSQPLSTTTRKESHVS